MRHLSKRNDAVYGDVKKFIDGGLSHDFVYICDTFFDEESFVVFDIIVCVCFDIITAVVDGTVEVEKKIVSVGEM